MSNDVRVQISSLAPDPKALAFGSFLCPKKVCVLYRSPKSGFPALTFGGRYRFFAVSRLQVSLHNLFNFVTMKYGSCITLCKPCFFDGIQCLFPHISGIHLYYRTYFETKRLQNNIFVFYCGLHNFVFDIF